MSDTVTGCVEHIIYSNPDNGYTVLEMTQDGEDIVVVGNFGSISEGETIKCQGYFVTHPTYGEQFKCESFEVTEPGDLISIERYLGSGAIKGIGPAMAARIVERFKEDTLRILDEEPERLSSIKGISKNGARNIAMQVAEKRELRNAMMYMQQYGISLAMAVRIYETYGQEVYEIIKNNPYQLADDISGIGFHTADEIARNTGLGFNSDFRIKSGICYVLVEAITEGHIYLPLDYLRSASETILGVTIDDFDQRLMELVIEKKIILKDLDGQKIVYSAPYYYMEQNVAHKLKEIDCAYEVDMEQIDEIFAAIADDGGLEPDKEQKRAVVSAVSHGVTVITGGPGTGKTTTIIAILRVFSEMKKKVLLAAPTGRAAKRMMEATTAPAVTVHRLLEVQGITDTQVGGAHFLRNEENPLDADVVIIDEMSMVDIFLMNSLVKAVAPGTRLILVGDANQLPSVGPGTVLKDIIASKAFEVVALTKIFRQDEAGNIILNAHKINSGEHIDTITNYNDFMFIRRADTGHILGAVATLVKEKLPPYVGAKSAEIQVLTPMRKGPLGVQNLNRVLQEAINPPAPGKREKQFPAFIIREGDKVIQNKNNYQITWTKRNKKGLSIGEGAGIFNGDIGVVREVNFFSEELVIVFDDDKEVCYPFRSVGELDLAYALTVHKSQGSEYPAVVLPLLTGPRPLMNRNLIYTAVTRAKQAVCVVGAPETMLAMIDNNEEQKRYTSLDIRIREAMSQGDEEQFN